MYKRVAVITLLMFFGCFALTGQELAHIRIDGINSSYDEHSPMLSPDGQTLYFTRAGHPANIGGVLDQGDIWLSQKTSNGWSQPVHAGAAINHPGLNGVVGFSADGQRMYLLNFFDPEGRGISKLKNGISVSTVKGGVWGVPEKLAIQFFSNESSHISATISKDEKVIIMAIQSYETEGNEDLYISFKEENGEWTQPKNMGNVLNTYAQEWVPFLSDDMKSLYFTSNGHGGIGGRDVFLSERQSDDSWLEWSTPRNLGEGFNTVGAEQGLSFISGDELAYFSSTQNSEGFGDVFAYSMPESIPEAEEVEVITPVVQPENDKAEEVVVEEEEKKEEEKPKEEVKEEVAVVVPVEEPKKQILMTFEVLDNRTEALVDADVVLTYNGEERTIKTADISSPSKRFELTLEEGTDLKVSIELEGYLKYQKLFKAGETSANEAAGIERLLLTREEVGTTVEIENVLFNRARSSFANPEVATRQIDELVQLMKDNPGMAIRLEGHTDNRGDEKLLQELSEERVKTVRDYMLSKGINGNRIEFIGYGGTKPLSDNKSPEGIEINRRVEFVIIR
ncbi:OmpA family protein [Roseivirga sp. E12]|uniref:OmpA family protein n=1 Tax=Roseivirga sp. E12 TaxID=2819237 RepID=UPI001ABC53DD|nr:OmpA family protein [Roseivirga sp. E12]MBO3696935.1 OmpA family protein [Roseivirga sp. E12]